MLQALYNNNTVSLPGWFTGLLLGVSFVGFLDAAYLTVNHIVRGATPCSLLEGCEVVTSSIYATIFGVPIALFGAIFYLAVLLLTLWHWDSKKTWPLSVVTILSTGAFVVSLVLMGIQAFVLQAFCLYCLISALSSTIIFILSLIYWNLWRPISV